ncbi:MAG: type II toxin-antitoxin system Phd/YefM family antitoxin [Gemmatimonadetes bacterium]|nr:type II toxin-antitoxin system Phd/YefM family antitoxin [Gemmatimonadota bacterium]
MTYSPRRSAPGVWKLHEAKARFSELFRQARSQGPQRVVKQGGEAVVVVPAEEFDRLRKRAGQPSSLVDFFRSAPTGGQRLDLKRKRDTMDAGSRGGSPLPLDVPWSRS